MMATCACQKYSAINLYLEFSRGAAYSSFVYVSEKPALWSTQDISPK